MGYGCFMMRVNIDPRDYVNIDESDLYDDKDGGGGYEDDPHVTLKWGIIDNLMPIPSDDVVENLTQRGIKSVLLTNIGCFENEIFDVVYLRVYPPELERMHDYLSMFPHIDTHPYSPHITLAYVKPGMGKKYVNNEAFCPFTAETKEIWYSYKG